MGGLLAVNQGSIDPPVFVVMEHKPKKAVNKQPYVFVGKGVVYDTGGISLKPNDGMMTMKCDMGGAAAVAGGRGQGGHPPFAQGGHHDLPAGRSAAPGHV